MNRKAVSVCATAAVAGLVALSSSSQVLAANLWWQSNATGDFTSANYYSDATTTTGQTPTTGDVVNFGKGGTGSYATGTEISLGKLRVGHNVATIGSATDYTGTGVLTVSGAGTKISTTLGASGADNAGVWVGHSQNGTLNIQDSANVTVNRLVMVGYGSNTNRAGNINISNGGSLTITLGNLNLSERLVGTTGNGLNAHVTVAGSTSSLTLSDPTADLEVGLRNTVADYTQTGGTVSIGDAVDVGASTGNASNRSTFTISGGSLSNGGSFTVGQGATVNATVNISDSGSITTGKRFLLGAGTATGIVVNQTGGTLNTTQDLRVADADGFTGDATYKLSGTGIINATTGGIVGRQGTGVFDQTGGTANFNAALAIGSRAGGPGTNSGLYKISAGTLAASGLNLAPNGVGELRVIGDDGTINVNGNFAATTTVTGAGTLRYQLESGDVLSQIGVTGTATFGSGVNLILDDSLAAPTQTTYNLLTATSITDSGLTFTGPAGWTYQIVSGGNGQILQAVVPEPTTLGLLAAGSVLLAARRRRRRGA